MMRISCGGIGIRDTGSRIVFQETFYFARNHQLLVGRDDHYFHARVVGTDNSFLRLGRIVFAWIEQDAELIQLRADSVAERRSVLANSGSKNKRVNPVQFQIKCSNPM